MLIENLCCPVKKLQEEVKRLRSIRDDKKEVNQISETCDGKGWKLMASDTGRKAPAPPQNLQSQDRVSSLIADKGMGALSNKALKPAGPKTQRKTRRKQMLLQELRFDELYYPLLLFHVGIKDTARGDLESIKCDCVSLGEMVKGMEAQVVSSSILLVRGKGLRRIGWTL
ncbi:hypothetical protein TURU_013791 [Turdus rufiventris]|nr:hypothetical protein TURU_013791 [Turdus rufiventris]